MAGRAKLRASHQVVVDTKIKDAKLRNSIQNSKNDDLKEIIGQNRHKDSPKTSNTFR